MHRNQSDQHLHKKVAQNEHTHYIDLIHHPKMKEDDPRINQLRHILYKDVVKGKSNYRLEFKILGIEVPQIKRVCSIRNKNPIAYLRCIRKTRYDTVVCGNCVPRLFVRSKWVFHMLKHCEFKN